MSSHRRSQRLLRSWLVALILVWPAVLAAQNPVTASYLNLGPDGERSRLLAKSGPPEGVITADEGTLYLDVDTALWYRKEPGTGNDSTGWLPATMITSTATSSTVKAPSFVRNNALTVSAGQGIGYWMQLAPASGGSCNTANPGANDFVAYYACMESVSGRDTATHGAGKGLWGTNFVLTANAGFNFSLVGHEIDIQNLAGEGTSVPAAFASNGKIGYGAVIASTATTDGDGSAAFASHVGGTDLNDLWKYGFEAAGTRTAAFYGRKSTNLGDVSPTSVFLTDMDATNFLKTTGTHTMLLDATNVKLYGSAGGRIGIHGSEPVLDFNETDQGADAKMWRVDVSGGTFSLQTVNDAYSAATAILSADRSGSFGIGGIPSSARVTIWGTGIQQAMLYDGSNYFFTTVGSTGTVTFDAAGSTASFLFADTPTVGTSKNLMPQTTHSSDIGSDTVPFKVLHAEELMVQTLTAKEVISTIGGNLVVAPTTLLTADLAPAGTTITVKHNSIANGDRLVMKGIGKTEWLLVTSAAGGGPDAYTYTVTRDADGSGANQWYVGDAVLDTGTTGDGMINLYSESEILINGAAQGPAITGYVRTGTDWNQLAPRWTIGNLNGTYGYVADTYGAAFGDASATNVTVDATNGFRIRSGTTNKFVADTSGNLSIVGDLSVGTSGIIRSGATSYAAGTGFVVDYNAGTPRMRIGTAAGNRMTWDGTTLNVVGDITTTSGTIGGCTIAASSITCGSTFTVTSAGALTSTSATIGGFVVGSDYIRDSGNSFGMASTVTGGTDVRFWAGDTFANRATAPFSVDEAGYLRTNAATFGSGSAGVDVDTSGLVVNGSGRILAGSGNVLIDNDGITLDAVGAASALINWTDGSFVGVANDGETLQLSASGAISLISSVGVFISPPSTTGAFFPLVHDSAIKQKTDGYNGTNSCAGGQYVDSITSEYGIVISQTCSTPFVPEVASLRAEVAELRSLIQVLMVGRKQ